MFTHLGISIDRIGMWVGLITAGYTVALDVAHHAVARRNHGWCKCLLQLLLLFPVLGPAVLEPNLKDKVEFKK